MKKQVQFWPAASLSTDAEFAQNGIEVAAGVIVLSLTERTPSANHRIVSARRHESGKAELHEDDTDITLVLAGRATLVAGGTMQSSEKIDERNSMGEGIVGGDSYTLKVGDLLNIPPQTPHQFLIAPGDSVTYLTIKVRSP